MVFDSEVETFQRQALEIREPGADFDPTTLPQTGEEYLMHMLYERKRCPAVVVRPTKVQSMEVNENAAAVNEERTKYTPPASLRPTPEWKTVQAANFEETRERINFMRQQLNEQNYDNALEPPLITDAAEWRTFCCNNPPLLSTILRLNQRTLENVLELFSDWLSCDEQQDEDIALDEETAQAEETKQEEKTTPEENMELDEETEQKNKTKQEKENAVQDQELIQESQPPSTSSSAPSAAAATSTSNANTLDLACSDQWLGSWLYAVLTCLHLPIEPNVHSTLREIARSCMRLRSKLLPQELEKAAPYNLFIYIIAKVFDQLDFTEFV